MEYSMESFINWCDEVKVAPANEETCFGDVKSKMKVSQARKVTTKEDLEKMIKQETAIIELTGDLEAYVEDKIKKNKIKVGVQLVGLFIPIVNFGIAAWVIADGLLEKGSVLKYRIYYSKKRKVYFVRKDIDPIE